VYKDIKPGRIKTIQWIKRDLQQTLKFTMHIASNKEEAIMQNRESREELKIYTDGSG